MAAKTTTLRVVFRKRDFSVDLRESATVGELRAAVAKQVKLDTNRVGIKYGAPDAPKNAKGAFIRLDDDEMTLKSTGIAGKPGAVVVSDYGLQFSYRGVFLLEYLGPILIVGAFALRPSFLFGAGSTPLLSELPATLKASIEGKPLGWNETVQAWAFVAWVLHFVKREVETLFVHKFSRGTMPLFNLFKNSAYYWGFASAVGYPIVSQAYTAPACREQVLGGFALMAVAELVNAAVHVQLAGMRPKEGSKKRDLPRGFLFSLVSCPNYTAEVLSWVGFSLATNIAFSWAFTLVGLAQMSVWALEKHQKYRKEFGSDADFRRRKAIIPFLL